MCGGERTRTRAHAHARSSDYGLAAVTPAALPDGNGDWSKFSLVNLPGKDTYPIINPLWITANNDLSGKGARVCVCVCT